MIWAFASINDLTWFTGISWIKNVTVIQDLSWDEPNSFAFKENVCKSKSVPMIWCVWEYFSLPCLYFAKYCNWVQHSAFLHLNLYFVVAGLEEILQNKQALDAFLCKLSVTCQTKYCLQMNEDGYITINFFNNVRCNILTYRKIEKNFIK